MTSTHKAEVIEVEIKEHPNADQLDIVQVWGYQCCTRKGEFKNGELAVYIVPDSLVDVRRPEFTFLLEQAKSNGKARIKAKKLRGVVSYGLLVKAPEGSKIGDDLAEQLGVSRYEPEQPSEKNSFVFSAEVEAGPELDTGPEKYDVESFERYANVLFTDGEPVYIAEKLDGSNGRFVYHDGRFWVKSRSRWVKRTADYSHITVEGLIEKGCQEDRAKEVVDGIAEKVARGLPTNSFWQVLENTPNLMLYLERNPGTIVFGEVYGNVNRIKYGLPEGNEFATFDIYRDGRFLDANHFVEECGIGNIPMVPRFNETSSEFPNSIDTISYSFDIVKQLAEGKTTVGKAKSGVIREGVVVRPFKERWDYKVGRVQLKCVSPTFLGKE